jgi:hypothetical protein
MNRFFVFLFMFLVMASGAFAQNNVWVATPSAMTQTVGGESCFGVTTPVVLNVASYVAYNLCSYLPSDDYSHIAIKVSSGAVYLQGTVATPTLGMYFQSSDGVIVLPLPSLPKSRGKIIVVSPDTVNSHTVKISGYRNY